MEPENNTKCYHAALYARRKFTDTITKDEPDPTAASQIKEMKNYLQDYPEIKVDGIYMDNHKIKQESPRPEFYRLAKDLKNGLYNCLVMTSLDLFAKDHMETKYYLLNLFAVMGIRILSIQDNYDSLYSEKAAGSHDRLEELVCQMDALSRSRILSRSSLQKKNDTFLEFTFTPFGYLYNPDIPSNLEIDEETVDAVRMIFKEYLSGTNMNQIAQKLTDMRIPSPSLRKEQLGMEYRHPSSKDYWTSGGVHAILKNPLYTGDLVIGKQRSAQYVFRDYKRHPDLDGNVIPNHHVAIISHADFERARLMMDILHRKRQEIIAKRPQPALPPTPFVNSVYCGICHRSMYHVRYNATSRNPYSIYVCSSHRQKLENACPLHHFRVDEIIPAVKDYIMEEHRLALTIIAQMQDGENSDLYQKIDSHFQQRIAKVMEKVQQNVLALTALPDEEEEKREKLNTESTLLRSELVEILDEKKKFSKEFTLKNKWLQTYGNIPENFELTRQYGRTLVERIELTPDQPLVYTPKHLKEKELLLHYITLSKEVPDGTKKQRTDTVCESDRTDIS
ncbi:MAG: recombinase family protein [Lachnospiraceae bacterium]|nr:recombinase family protein [Lachnospiraceae bacterium]